MSQNFGSFGSETGQDLDAAGAPSSQGGDDFLFEDEKKPLNRNLVALLLIVLIGGGGLYFMYNRSGIAAGAATAAAGDPDAMRWLGDAPKAVGEMRRSLDETRRMVRIFERIGQRPQVAMVDLKTNPFMKGPSAEVVAVANKDGEVDPRVVQIQIAMQDLRGLQVQSVLAAGENSSCVINKVLLRVGQTIKSGSTEFTVTRIEASREGARVVLSAYGQQFTRAMNSKTQP